MKRIQDIGIQSYCFREFKDNAEVARKVREIGLDKIEVCAVHANFNNEASWKEVIAVYRDAGISIPSIGVQTFTGNPSEESYFACASAAGAKHISAHFKVGTYPGAIAQVKQWSKSYGICVGIHTHGGWMFGGQPDVMRHLIDLGQPEIGLCLDTAWAMQIGPQHGNPVQWARDYSGLVYAIHFKDFVFDRDGQWHDVVVGEGNLDLAGLVAELRNQDFSGPGIIEYEADPADPVPALKECVEKMRPYFEA